VRAKKQSVCLCRLVSTSIIILEIRGQQQTKPQHVRSAEAKRLPAKKRRGQFHEASPQKELQRSNGESEEAKRLPLSSGFYIDIYSRNHTTTAIGATACTER